MVKTRSGSQGAVHEQDPESTANRESQASTLKRKANVNAYADDAKKSAQASRKNENRSSSSAKTRKAFSKSTQRGGSNASSDWLSGFEPPSWWPEALDKISEMRKDGNIASNAAVDSLGAEAAKHSLPNESELSEKQQRLIVLASAMLSSQTQDAVTHACVARLRATLPGGLCPEGLLAVSQQYLGRELIKPVGFWSRKASYLQRTAQMLIDKHDGDIPPTLDQLLELPGVGPKMAHLVMNVAWRDPNGVPPCSVVLLTRDISTTMINDDDVHKTQVSASMCMFTASAGALALCLIMFGILSTREKRLRRGFQRSGMHPLIRYSLASGRQCASHHHPAARSVHSIICAPALRLTSEHPLNSILIF